MRTTPKWRSPQRAARRRAGAASLAHLATQKRMSSTKSVDGLRGNENVVDIGVYTDPE
jgi:hypothetical protein